MPTPCAGRLDVLRPIIHEHRLRRCQTKPALGLRVNGGIRFHDPRLEGWQSAVANAIHAVPGDQMFPVQITDIRQQVNAMLRRNLARQPHHVLAWGEDIQPLLAQSSQRRPRRQPSKPLDQARAIQAPGFMVTEPDLLERRIQIHPRRAMTHEKIEHGLRMNADEYPANVEDDVADQTGITVPWSAAVMFTETTVALGKKLNSEALAQV